MGWKGRTYRLFVMVVEKMPYNGVFDNSLKRFECGKLVSNKASGFYKELIDKTKPPL